MTDKLSQYQQKLREVSHSRMRLEGQIEVIEKEMGSLENDLLQRYGCSDQEALQRTLQNLYTKIVQSCDKVEKIFNG